MENKKMFETTNQIYVHNEYVGVVFPIYGKLGIPCLIWYPPHAKNHQIQDWKSGSPDSRRSLRARERRPFASPMELGQFLCFSPFIQREKQGS